MQGQLCDTIPPQLVCIILAPPLVTSSLVPILSAVRSSLRQPRLGPMLTRALWTFSWLTILRPFTSWPRWTREEASTLCRPTHRVSLVPKLIPVRRQLRCEKPLTRQCILMTCTCLWESDTVSWKPPRCTPLRTQPQHLVASPAMKLLTARWARSLFRLPRSRSRPQPA